jgi:hypothetical protein
VGSLGFDDLKEQVKYRLGMDTSPETVGTNSLNFYGIWVNHAYKQICSSHRLMGINKRFRIPELETSTTASTVDGTAYISTPSDCVVVRTVYDTTNNAKLDQIAWKKYISYTDRTNTTAEGDPTEWTRAGARIYLHPTPDAAMTMTVYYKKLPSDLTGTATTEIGAEWDEPIILLASYKGFTWTGQFDKAKACREELLETIAGLIQVYGEEELDSDIRLAPTDAYMSR